MPTLAEICKSFDEAMSKIDELEPDQISEQIQLDFENEHTAFKDKLDSWYRFLSELEKASEQFKAKSQIYTQKHKVYSNKLKKAEETIKRIIEANPHLIFKGTDAHFKLRKNPKSLKVKFELDEIDDFFLEAYPDIAEFIDQKMLYSVRKKDLKDAVVNGSIKPHDDLLEITQGQSLRTNLI
jgi:hypothetical protein